MKTSHNELQRYEELVHWGTSLDPMIVEKARAACRGLEITQSGGPLENVVYIETAGGFGIMLSVEIENISDKIICIDAIRLKMPWFDGDFCWQKKLSSKGLRERGGYVLSACGTCGFEPDVILNHRFGRNFRLYSGDVIEGFLLGEGTTSVPEEFSDRRKVPMQLVVYLRDGKSYSGWMELVVSRNSHQMQCKPAIEQRRRRLSLNK